MNMRTVKLLDCTLRDGGRVIDCKFPNKIIYGISTGLAKSGINIVELGFLRDRDKVQYTGDSTFFTHVNQMAPFISREINPKTQYVAFVDEGMFDADSIPDYDGTSIDGIRYGFTKKSWPSAITAISKLQSKGYRIFVQAVDTLSYSDAEILQMVEEMNKLRPYSFGIVDTYGAMYDDDFAHYFSLIDHNLDKEICIDFHSHNNYQLSFSLAQKAVNMASGRRNLIIDSTLNGMGKRAGNLNTELIANYLNQKHHYGYNLDIILDHCDEYIEPLKQVESWGYSTPAFLAGVFRAHPNNIIYLTDKLRMGAKSIKAILEMIDEDTRKTYDYDNIERLYFEYSNHHVDDSRAFEVLRDVIGDRSVLILAPGHTLSSHEAEIEQYVSRRLPQIISVNFVDSKHSDSLVFMGRQGSYDRSATEMIDRQALITSNVKSNNPNDLIYDYYSATNRGWKHFDNSVVMLLRILFKLNIQNIAFAGFDGFSHDILNNYSTIHKQPFNDLRSRSTFDDTNKDLASMLLDYALHLKDPRSIEFVTPSLFEKCFETKD